MSSTAEFQSGCSSFGTSFDRHFYRYFLQEIQMGTDMKRGILNYWPKSEGRMKSEKK